MIRKNIIKKQLINIVKNSDSQELYSMLFDFQHVKMMRGYSTATIMGFEDNKIGVCADDKMSLLMKSGEYDLLFEEWLNEKV